MKLWPITLFLRKFSFYLMRVNIDKERIAFFSYYYSGNAKPVYEALVKKSLFKKPYWVLLDEEEVKRLRNKGIEAYYYRDSKAFKLFLSTPIWVSTHIEDRFPMPKHKNILDYFKDSLIDFLEIEKPPTSKNIRIREIQLWHGLGFKGWRKDRKRDYLIHSDVYCFTSEFFKNIWIEEFKIDPARIKITGYARHDMLINRSYDSEAIKMEIGVPKDSRIILFAPTWEQREDTKSIYYWRLDKIKEINDFCENNNAFFIVRTHHMQKTGYPKYNFSRFIYLPVDEYSNTMNLLCVTDALITDWSSIANDYIFLNRPTIFIDTPNPFDDDFELLPEDRAGFILKDPNNIIETLQDVFKDKQLFVQQYKKVRDQLLRKIYENPDGNATERCIQEIIKIRDDLI